VDGSVLAQMGAPDMRTPIAYALAWPERMGAPVARLDLAALGKLTFEAPDLQRFPALRLARQALQGGRAAPTILNAANEVAVAAFLGRRIRFLDIARVVETALSVVPNRPIATIADVLEIDTFARRVANETIDTRESP
jgi:1-deoxy-D-xylulose-5-phosphate reductoisomerase